MRMKEKRASAAARGRDGATHETDQPTVFTLRPHAMQGRHKTRVEGNRVGARRASSSGRQVALGWGLATRWPAAAVAGFGAKQTAFRALPGGSETA